MDPLKYLFEKPALSGRLLRWLILLAEFDLKYVARKTIKGSVMPDFYAENPIEGKDGKEDFLDEDILDVKLWTWKMYFKQSHKPIREWDRNTLDHSQRISHIFGNQVEL